ncbi:MAG: DNA primase [Betaproteobacteria bacterium]|nr:DNA primase [Betaproteobacteria bacterium]MCL2162681.1 DNA primase [Betaproteobacteria bacterium]
MIPESFIQDLLTRIDIVDLIDRYVHLKKAGANYIACCPFHSEKTPSFSVSPSKQFYYCFGCGAHGTAISFLMEYQGLGFVEAIRELASSIGVAVPDERHDGDSSQKRETLRDLLEVMARARDFYREALKKSEKAVNYLKERGLSGETAARFGIGYAPEGWNSLKAAFPDSYDYQQLLTVGLVLESEEGRRYDRFRDRIIFPIINSKGETIGFGGRVIGQGEPKYLNSPETPLFEKGRELFGLPQARQTLRAENRAIVVEGYMDVVALAEHGVGNALATLGTATTREHAQKLLRQVDAVVFCFDGDNAGRKAAWRALENTLDSLTEQKSVSFTFLPEAEDPDSFIRKKGKKAFDNLIREAAPLSSFLINELKKQCDLTSAEGRARLVADAKPLLLRLSTPFLRLQLVKQLAAESGFSQAEVERLCGIQSYAPKPPLAKPKRSAPSLARTLARLALQRPALAGRIPLELLPPSEERAILEVILTNLPRLPSAPTYAQLREQLRGHPLEAEFNILAGEWMQLQLAEDKIEHEFLDALTRLQENKRKSEFADLQKKASQFGITGLTAEEKEHYKASAGKNRSDPYR